MEGYFLPLTIKLLIQLSFAILGRTEVATECCVGMLGAF